MPRGQPQRGNRPRDGDKREGRRAVARVLVLTHEDGEEPARVRDHVGRRQARPRARGAPAEARQGSGADVGPSEDDSIRREERAIVSNRSGKDRVAFLHQADVHGDVRRALEAPHERPGGVPHGLARGRVREHLPARGRDARARDVTTRQKERVPDRSESDARGQGWEG